MSETGLTPATQGVLFVCLGNICRSPIAEGVFLHMLETSDLKLGLKVDSAGTGGWHVGQRPDPRAVAVANSYRVQLPSRARQVVPEDFFRFSLIVAMDQQNLRDLERLRPDTGTPTAPLVLLRRWDPEARGDLDVPDPYYGGPEGFDTVFRMVERACRGLLDHLTTPD